MTVFLVGGGPQMLPPGLLTPFIEQVRVRAVGGRPRIAVVVDDAGGAGRQFLPAYATALDAGRDVEVAGLLLRHGQPPLPAQFDGVHGLVVGGGATPHYRDGLAGLADVLAASVAAGLPYLGFSAGAMVAPRDALVGGSRLAGRGVCPEEWAEDLVETTVLPGLGLVSFAVDVHTAQAGTLGRTVAVVGSGAVPVAVGIDEDTCLAVEPASSDPADGTVTGAGAVWVVCAGDETSSVQVTRRTAV